MHAHHYLGEANTDTLLYKLWQKLHDTPQRAAQPDSRTRQATAKPLAHAQFSNKFWSMPNVTLKEHEQVLKYRTETIHTDKHTNRFSHTTGPATCPLCGRSDSAPHILLRCNNHTLKRMHINWHHHTVSLCGEEISEGKLGSAIVIMDACNSEKLSDLNIEPPDDIERNIHDWVFPTQQNLPTRHQSRPDGVFVIPIEGRGRHWDPKQIPTRDRHASCRIQILLRHKPATDMRKSTQPTSTSYPASTNKGPLRYLSKQQSHTSWYNSWVRGTIYNQYTITPFLNMGMHPHEQSTPS
jgi:hypothetical protein